MNKKVVSVGGVYIQKPMMSVMLAALFLSAVQVIHSRDYFPAIAQTVLSEKDRRWQENGFNPGDLLRDQYKICRSVTEHVF
jgi:hypothetical protein